MIQNSHSGKILCVGGQATSSGAKVIQHQNQELPHQKWSLELVFTDHFKISNVNSNLFLSIQDDQNLVAIQSEDQNQCWVLSKLSGDSGIDIHKLIGFYNSTRELRVQDCENYVSPELRNWYETFLRAFFLEVIALIGVFPMPLEEDLAVVIEFILSDSSIVAQLQSLVKHSTSFDSESFVSIFITLWDKDLWSAILKCLLRQIWSLPTLVRATIKIRAFICGAGTAHTMLLLNKAVLLLGNLCTMKPLES